VDVGADIGLIVPLSLNRNPDFNIKQQSHALFVIAKLLVQRIGKLYKTLSYMLQANNVAGGPPHLRAITKQPQ